MRDEIMRLERQKSVIRAIAELEISLNTFYNDSSGNYERLRKVYDDLFTLKKDYLD